MLVLDLLTGIAGKLPGHEAAPQQAVGRAPGLGLEPQQQEFRRQRKAVPLKERIDAGRIGVERGAQIGRGRLILRVCLLRQPQQAHQLVGLQRREAEQLGQPAGAEAAHQLHLEQAILGVHEAEREIGIELGLGGDGDDARTVAADGQGRGKAGIRQPHLAGDFWQRAQQRPRAEADGRDQQDNNRQQSAREPTPDAHTPDRCRFHRSGKSARMRARSASRSGAALRQSRSG